MKKVLVAILMLLPIVASAESVEIDGIYYSLVNKIKSAEVTNNPNKYTGVVTIPESVTYNDVTYHVTSIGSSAFSGCRNLTNITIPNSVTSIGEYAFDKCNSLTEVHISDLAAWCNIKFDTNSNPLSYAHHLYMNGEEVIDLVIPNSVTNIREAAFAGCSSLMTISIPNSVTNIEHGAFASCSGIKSITIPNSVTSIWSGVFAYCSGLTSIIIPNSVTFIGNYTFAYCSSLTNITIPNSLTSISSELFQGCI